MTGSGEVDNPIQINAERVCLLFLEALAQCILVLDESRTSFSNMQVEEATPSTSHHTTQSLNAHASISPPDYEGFFQKFAELLNVSRLSLLLPLPVQQQHSLSLNHIVSNDGHGLNHSGSNHPFGSHIESRLSHGGLNRDGLNHL
jgi:hypothetical protein